MAAGIFLEIPARGLLHFRSFKGSQAFGWIQENDQSFLDFQIHETLAVPALEQLNRKFSRKCTAKVQVALAKQTVQW